MARTSDIAIKERQELLGKLEEKYSKKAIEDFFGIVIKEIDTEKHLYNLYKDNELVYAKVHSFDMVHLFQSIAYRFINRMCTESEQDNNIEETEKKVAELEAREIANEKENYYTCPNCGAFVKKGSHFHR